MTSPGGFEIASGFINVSLRAGGALAALAGLQVGAATAGAALSALPALAASVGSSAIVMGNSLSAVSDAVEAHSKAVTKNRIEEIKATQGVTTEMAKYIAALEEMGPAQQKVTKQVIEMQDAWGDLVKAGNEPFMEGVSEFLEDADDLFPILKENLRDTGRILGGLAEDLGDLFASQKFQQNLDQYLDNSEVVTQSIADNFVELTGAAVEFGAAMDQSATGFAGFIDSSSAGIQEFLANLQKYDADFQRIWDAWGDIVNAVLPAVGEAIGQIAHTIAPVFEDIGNFLQSNKDSLDEWIVGLVSLGAVIVGLKVAGSVIRGISGLTGALGSLGSISATTAVRLGLVGAAVGGIIYAFSDAANQFDGISEAFAKGEIGLAELEAQVRSLDEAWSSSRWRDSFVELGNWLLGADTIFGEFKPFEEYNTSAEEAIRKAEELRAAMSPLELAQVRVTEATRLHADAVKAFGDSSPQAQEAQRALATAVNEEEAAQLAAKRATQDHTDALRAQQDQLLAMSDANLAQRQAQLDLKQAQEDLTAAVREYGVGSDEAEQAQIRFEQAQNRVITATQRQTQVAGEGKTATDQSRLASEQFTYTSLALAAQLGNQASPAVQQFAADMSDAELQAFNAAQKTSGFHTEIMRLPDGREVYIRTDPETGEVIQYREELLRIPPVVSIRVTADGRYSISSNGIKVNNVTGDVYGPGRSGLADGGILPGYTPGQDVHWFTGQNGEQLGFSGGEAVMRPEWTQAVGAAFINGGNEAARKGGVAGVRRFMGADEDVPQLRFAAGGIYDFLPPMAKDQANDLISTQSAHLARAVGDAVKNIFAGGGPLGGAGGGGGWQWQMRVLRQVFPGLQLISGFRPGAITATGNRSYHSMGRAVDIPPRMDLFNWIRSTYGANTRELIFSPAGGRQVHNGRPHVYSGITRANHWDHVHWAYDQGGMLQPGTTIAQNNTGKPEGVFTQEQMRHMGGVTINGPIYVNANSATEFLNSLEQVARKGSKIRAGRKV